METGERIQRDNSSIADEIISRMHSYETDLGRFVDREVEAREILEQGWGRPIRGGRITVLYGPKGCGKSTFFEALRHSLAMLEREGLDSGYELVYVVTRPDDPWDLSRVYSSTDLWGLVVEVISSLGGSLDQHGFVKGLVDADRFITILEDRIARKFEKSKNILIVLDEVRINDEESLWGFRGWLEAYANMVARYNRDYSEKRGSIAVVALTSDALVREIRYVVGDKVNWAVIWKLSRDASEKLISQIELHKRITIELGIGSEEAEELLWRLTGGNPRALGRIWRNRLMGWLEREVINRILGFVQDIPMKMRRKALDLISASLDKVDDIGWTDPEIWKTLVRHNIIMYIAAADKISEIPEEPWIGKRFAFQIPAYYYALKAIARKRSWKITAGEVILSMLSHELW